MICPKCGSENVTISAVTESKQKRIISAVTVGAVLLLVILVSVMVYQLISISVKNKQIEALKAEIAVYERMIENEEDENLIRQERDWIERRARELGYKLPSDIFI